MRGMGADIPALVGTGGWSGNLTVFATEGGVGSAFVERETGQFAIGTAATQQAVTEVQAAESAIQQVPVRITGPSFADISKELGLEAPGTINYRSTAAAAAAARAAGLENTTRPGFQSHSTASTVRNVFNISGRIWQSAHIVPQAVYRALRSRGLRVSEGRAFTTLLPSQAHAAFDRTWIREWNDAVSAGRTIRTRDVFEWVSRAINAVDPALINNEVKGAILDRLRTELFVELGLNLNDVIIMGVP
jgi:hypothetical protein